MKKEFLAALKVYLFSWLFVIAFFLYNVFGRDIPFLEMAERFLEIASSSRGIITIHILFAIFYISFLIVRYFIRVYKKRGIRVMGKHLTLRLFSPTLIVILVFKFIIYNNTNESFTYKWDNKVENTNNYSNDLYKDDGKHRGMSVFGWGPNNEARLKELLKANIEWVAVVPFFYQSDEQTKTMDTPKNLGEWSGRDSTFINSMQQIHDKRMHIMLKPHLWMSSGWRSNVNMNSKAEWDTWFNSYRKNILHYAKMATQVNAEVLCIGTELKSSLKQQPEQWSLLIKEIRSVYNGKLTYAANWDSNFESIDFWGELDYIGIQAYFPLTKNKNPELETIKQGWDRHIIMLEALSKKYNKPILFTEVGYRSDPYATVRPWEWGSVFSSLHTKKSDRTQQLAYQALFEKLWDKHWFAGTYPWQWRSHDFPIHSRPAENTIAKWYAKTNF